ncbi:MAG TPA: peptide deformylase [Candidatus Paceibacterota bacterium]
MDIVIQPNKILRKKLDHIAQITPEITRLVSDMKKKMVEAGGVGLAANQVGLDLQIFVIDKKLAIENEVPEAYINPEMTEYSKDEAEMEEGCLSIPNYWHQIKRAKKIKLKAIDESGKKIKIKAKGFLARVLQHEFDHLQGMLIKDRISK